MKTKDILTALGSVSEQYKREAEEENAGRFFKESKSKTVIGNIIKYSLSAAAVFALAVFVIAVVKTKYMDKNNMVMPDSGVMNSISETTLERGIVNNDGNVINIDEVKINACELQGGEPKEIGKQELKKPDHVIQAGCSITDANGKYRLVSNGNDNGMDFAKIENGTVKWRISIKSVFDCGGIKQYIETENESVLVLYHTEFYRDDICAALQLFDKNGQSVWGQVAIKDGYNERGYRMHIIGLFVENGRIYVVGFAGVEDSELIKEPGTYRVYGERFIKLMIAEYSLETGEELSEKYADTNLYGKYFDVHCIGKTEAGYVVTYHTDTWNMHVLLVDNDCNIVSINDYGSGYEFCSVEYHNGEIYLSGKLMQPEINLYYDFYFSHDPCMYYYERAAKHSNQNDENLTVNFLDETAAVLLVCDTSLRPARMYTQKAAFGGKLYKSDDGLVWDVCEISYAESSVLYDVCTIIAGGSASYTFNGKGVMTAREENGKIYASVGDVVTE